MESKRGGNEQQMKKFLNFNFQHRSHEPDFLPIELTLNLKVLILNTVLLTILGLKYVKKSFLTSNPLHISNRHLPKKHKVDFNSLRDKLKIIIWNDLYDETSVHSCYSQFHDVLNGSKTLIFPNIKL